MILHTRDGRKIKGKFLNRNQNSVCVETDNDGPRAIGIDQLRSVERQRVDKLGTNERGQPVTARDAANLASRYQRER